MKRMFLFSSFNLTMNFKADSRAAAVWSRSMMWMSFFLVKMYGFIFGCHLEALWPKCTPAASIFFIRSLFIFFL